MNLFGHEAKGGYTYPERRERGSVHCSQQLSGLDHSLLTLRFKVPPHMWGFFFAFAALFYHLV